MANQYYIAQNEAEDILWALGVIDKLPFYKEVLGLSDAEAAELLGHCKTVVAPVQYIQATGDATATIAAARQAPGPIAKARAIQFLLQAGMGGEW